MLGAIRNDLEEEPMNARATIAAVVLDAADPPALAEFYRKVTGWELDAADEDFVSLRDEGAVRLAVQRVVGHHAPAWPDERARVHLDLAVDDPAGAVAEMLALGATRPEFQPGGDDWVVLADPEGHVFCVAAAG
jgi:catechol 2,3-dioxygenase-like lactoylglutathione lyase family enzyme